jgi:hypothetical protein
MAYGKEGGGRLKPEICVLSYSASPWDLGRSPQPRLGQYVIQFARASVVKESVQVNAPMILAIVKNIKYGIISRQFIPTEVRSNIALLYHFDCTDAV